ncbi:MAG TPA: aminotransferase class I/II-fold pyridoxal phosphate-dependent enzyme [Pyrinomonadaceae bacterium]|jgi:aspartate/methionine/tyrosine aminotransferase|nr:aminotransferase class I/II-fold pyridoxal phosphate-dependent enzyme [Pyrinomonadaceae bacterium]
MSEALRVARVMSSEYMLWAKTRSQARFNLASSGLANFPLARLSLKLEDLELSGQSYYGYEPLQKRLADKLAVNTSSVVAATGTSMANHLAMAAIIEPGDEVLIEYPTYELIRSTAQYLGASVKRFTRRFEENFRLDPDEISKEITSRTRLVVLTNLHNPSSAYADELTLRRVGEMAREVGARVLVDEVYLDAMFESAPRSAFHLGQEFICTSSLTKVYGLSGLRCGWILAPPELAQKIWRLADLFGVIPAHAAELLSCLALDQLSGIEAHARGVLETNGALLNSFFDSRHELSVARYEHGTVAFPLLREGSVDALCALLVQKYETSVVPGRFFEMPQHFRIGIGGETASVEEGLHRLGLALDELRNL